MYMKTIKSEDIVSKVREAFIKANLVLPCDVISCLEKNRDKSQNLERKVMEQLIENTKIAKEINVPVCQDTGMAVVFVKIGESVHIVDGNISDAINEGVKQAYVEGDLRLSVVSDPLFERKNTETNTPAIIHYEYVKGDTLEIYCMPKGFGSENMSRIKMFNPTATKEEIEEFIVSCVKEAGSNPCPPVVLGIGIGGDFEYSALLSKKALLRGTDKRNEKAAYADFENEILEKVNKTGIGAQGFGGDVTCLAVNIEYFPTHIAGLPVAVNICCHVLRHEKVIL